MIIAVIPNVFENWEWARTNPAFLKQTQEKRLVLETRALTEDVETGLANRVGERISKTRVIPTYPIFYDRIARENPDNPASRLLGYGRFNAELWALNLIGFDFKRFSKSGFGRNALCFRRCFSVCPAVSF